MKNDILTAMAYGFGGIIGMNLGCLFCKFVTEVVSEMVNYEGENDGKD